jgi:hypothetical protein
VVALLAETTWPDAMIALANIAQSVALAWLGLEAAAARRELSGFRQSVEVDQKLRDRSDP